MGMQNPKQGQGQGQSGDHDAGIQKQLAEANSNLRNVTDQLDKSMKEHQTMHHPKPGQGHHQHGPHGSHGHHSGPHFGGGGHSMPSHLHISVGR